VSPSGHNLRAVAVRLVLLIAVLVVATWGAHMVREALDLHIRPGNEQQIHRAIMLGALAYIGLLALPFVPGAEIGLAMLTAFGPGIAPLIYVTTVTSMMLAYSIGRFLPIGALERLFSVLRMHRAAKLVARAAPLTQEERLAMLLEGQTPRMLKLALRYRYIAMALAVNTPGNSLIGGGGGIMIMVGLSGLFTPMQTLIAILVAVSPVPLAVFFLGLQI
jgi:flagellar biosynthesis protein FlhB